MKEKRCKQCGEVFTYDDWERVVLKPNEVMWLKKKFCCATCRIDYNNDKVRKRKKK